MNNERREAKLALAVVHSLTDLNIFQCLRERGDCKAADVSDEDTALSWLNTILEDSHYHHDSKKEQEDHGLTIVSLLLDKILTQDRTNPGNITTWAEAFQVVEESFPTPFEFGFDSKIETISKLELLLHLSMEKQKQCLLSRKSQRRGSNQESIVTTNETKAIKSPAVECKVNILEILSSLVQADDVKALIESSLQNERLGALSEEQQEKVMGYCQCISQEYQVRKEFLIRNFELTKLAFQENEKVKSRESSNASNANMSKGVNRNLSNNLSIEDSIKEIGERVAEKLSIEKVREAVQHRELSPDSFLMPSTLSKSSQKSTMRSVTIQSNLTAHSVEDDRHAMPAWEEGQMKAKSGKYKRENYSKSKGKR